MLRNLRIENLVLIREANLAFGPGLNAITGETGAGKSIAANAFGLLMGLKADASMVGPHGTEAYVEAEFDLPKGLLEEDEFESLRDLRPDDEEPGIVLARRVSADGRSRAYAWGRSIAKDDLAAISERLLSLSGQFEQRRLAKPAYQLDLLDAYVGEEQLHRREETGAAWKLLTAARKRREALAQNAGAEHSRLEQLRALVEATDGWDASEEAELVADHKRLGSMHALVTAVQVAGDELAPEDSMNDGQGAADRAASAEHALAAVADVAPELGEIATELNAAEAQIRDISSRLRSFLHDLEADPGRLEQVEQRLSEISDAKRRFRCEDYVELIERRDAAAAELSLYEEGADPLEQASAELEVAQAAYDAIAGELNKARKDASAKFCKAVKVELAALGMGAGEMQVELTVKAAGPRGVDEVGFQIKPNAGLPFAPLASTASGGELSRIALALRVVSHARSGEGAIIFDEIDAGIGGVTAHAVAKSLERLGERSQVIAITHLSQIASVAGTHLQVEKLPGDPTQTQITVLDADGRKAELERMLGGADFLASVA